MSDALNTVYDAVDDQHSEESAATRRKFVAGAAATLGSMGILGLVNNDDAWAKHKTNNTPKNILAVAATAEVLATIVNTVGSVGGQGSERFQGPVSLPDAVTLRNVKSAAREELVHYDVLIKLGGKPVTKKIWIPDAVFSNAAKFLSALEVGDQIFVNAYLIGTTTFGNAGNGKLARQTAEFMGVEAVHRALARQSLGKLANDRVFIRYNGRERADAPNRGQKGFTDILKAVDQLKGAGFGFGQRGETPGQFYEFNAIKGRTPNDPFLNTSLPQ